MNRIINAKKKVNENLEKLEMVRQYYSDKLQDLVYKKRPSRGGGSETGEFIHGDLLDTLEDLEYEADTKFSDLVQLYREEDEDSDILNKVIVQKGNRYTKEKNKSISLNQEKDGTQELKVNQYDINIVDNMYIIYYFLSYGIMGLFINKLLKQ